MVLTEFTLALILFIDASQIERAHLVKFEVLPIRLLAIGLPLIMLGIILTGAALIRERKHGTIKHLLVMPVTPAEIMLAKIWTNGLVILIATLLLLWLVVNKLLAVPIHGSVALSALAPAL